MLVIVQCTIYKFACEMGDCPLPPVKTLMVVGQEQCSLRGSTKGKSTVPGLVGMYRNRSDKNHLPRAIPEHIIHSCMYKTLNHTLPHVTNEGDTDLTMTSSLLFTNEFAAAADTFVLFAFLPPLEAATAIADTLSLFSLTVLVDAAAVATPLLALYDDFAAAVECPFATISSEQSLRLLCLFLHCEGSEGVCSMYW